jgi:tRNA (cytidine/uridine-2'-O-)-methyltransferase
MLNLVLYQPDIAQNLGACLRLAACLGCRIHIIEPCGFPLDDARMRRAGMDYIDKAHYIRHLNWHAFLDYKKTQDSAQPTRSPLAGESKRAPRDSVGGQSRLLLLETDGAQRYTDITFSPNDYVVIGSEGAGTPRALYPQMDATLTIPMREGMRSLNLAMSAGILVAEACRQMDWKFE